MAWYVFAQDHAEGILTQALLSPGSTLHALKALEHPRWEDYEYERADASPNRLYWLGDGQASDEMSPSGNSESPIDASSWYNTDLLCSGAWYLDDDYIDRPPGGSLTLILLFAIFAHLSNLYFGSFPIVIAA